MARFISAPNVSDAWVLASQDLLEAQPSTLSNLCVEISNPTVENQEVRNLLESFRSDCMAERRRRVPPSIKTVASTIFPNEFYRRSAANPAEHLFELERMIRPAVNQVHQNRRGTYFQRLASNVNSKNSTERDLNQLRVVLNRLRWSKRQGHRNGNKFELSIFDPARDSNLQGFPCLSHVSLTLSEGVLSATALYRNQYYVDRAYGNFLGLGNLLTFLAAESGFDLGELVAVASHARLEVADYGKGRLKDLLSKCNSARSGST